MVLALFEEFGFDNSATAMSNLQRRAHGDTRVRHDNTSPLHFSKRRPHKEVSSLRPMKTSFEHGGNSDGQAPLGSKMHMSWTPGRTPRYTAPTGCFTHRTPLYRYKSTACSAVKEYVPIPESCLLLTSTAWVHHLVSLEFVVLMVIMVSAVVPVVIHTISCVESPPPPASVHCRSPCPPCSTGSCRRRQPAARFRLQRREIYPAATAARRGERR